MDEPTSRRLRLDDLKRAIAELRRALPEDASIVPLASVRARDRIEIMPGMVAPFGLASSAFCDDQYGDYSALEGAYVHVFLGMVEGRHMPELLPAMESAVRARAPIVLVADEIDEHVIALITMNRRKGTMLGSALLPHPNAGEQPLGAFAALTVAGYGEATPAGIKVLEPGRVPRLVSTLHETIVVGPLPLLLSTARVGVLHVGGEDLATARARAWAAREIISRSMN